jgi:preprotein translocase subunit SecD
VDTVHRVHSSYEEDSEKPLLVVELNDKAARHFSRITAQRIGKPMEFRLDGRVVAAPIVLERVTGGTFQITNLPPEDFERAKQEMEKSCGPSDATRT